MSTAILAPPPVAAFQAEDEMFDLDLRVVWSGPVVSGSKNDCPSGSPGCSNTVPTDFCSGGPLCQH